MGTKETRNIQRMQDSQTRPKKILFNKCCALYFHLSVTLFWFSVMNFCISSLSLLCANKNLTIRHIVFYILFITRHRTSKKKFIHQITVRPKNLFHMAAALTLLIKHNMFSLKSFRFTQTNQNYIYISSSYSPCLHMLCYSIEHPTMKE